MLCKCKFTRHSKSNHQAPTPYFIRIKKVKAVPYFTIPVLKANKPTGFLRAIHTDQFSGTSSWCQSTCNSKLACVSCQ